MYRHPEGGDNLLLVRLMNLFAIPSRFQSIVQSLLLPYRFLSATSLYIALT